VRDFYKNPMFYYLLAPIVVAIWPLLVWAVYLPDAREKVDRDQSLCVEGTRCMLDILTYDPERLNKAVNSDNVMSGTFSFPNAINRVSNLCGIRSDSGGYTAGRIITTSGKKSQNGRVMLKNVGIVQAATFLSQMQTMYINLKCDQVKLTQKKGMPDQWDVDMDFWYTY
jgi:hypothetical protein